MTPSPVNLAPEAVDRMAREVLVTYRAAHGLTRYAHPGNYERDLRTMRVAVAPLLAALVDVPAAPESQAGVLKVVGHALALRHGGSPLTGVPEFWESLASGIIGAYQGRPYEAETGAAGRHGVDHLQSHALVRWSGLWADVVRHDWGEQLGPEPLKDMLVRHMLATPYLDQAAGEVLMRDRRAQGLTTYAHDKNRVTDRAAMSVGLVPALGRLMRAAFPTNGPLPLQDVRDVALAAAPRFAGSPVTGDPAMWEGIVATTLLHYVFAAPGPGLRQELLPAAEAPSPAL